MQNQKPKTSRAKALVGGLVTIGIFASFFAFQGGAQSAENLKADVVAVQTLESTAVQTTEPKITAIEPSAGAVGEIVSIVVVNLDNLTRGTGGLFFGDTPAEIETIDQSVDGTLTVFTHVPEVTETGNYKIKITTPNQLLESESDFLVTATSGLAPAPIATTDESTSKPTPATDNPIVLEMSADPLAENTESVEVSLTPSAEPEEIVTPDEPIVTTPVYFGEPPRNLTATLGSGGIELDWEAPQGSIDHFNVYYGTTSGKYIHRVEAQNLFIFLNSNFVDGTTYYFMVSAVYTDGSESTGSNETAAIYSSYVAAQSVELLHASAQPQKLSEEGPAETLAISVFIALGLSSWLFRRKIFARN